MATPVLLPVSEYLDTTYRPDRDFVGGEVRERSMGEKPHGLLQGILFSVFQSKRKEWDLLPVLEQRVQTGLQTYRVPDLCLIRPRDAAESIVSVAPVLCVEVLSKDDSLTEMQERVDDYVAMGIAAVWVVDPLRRYAYTASREGFVRVHDRLAIKGSSVRVELVEIFAELDNLLAGRL